MFLKQFTDSPDKALQRAKEVLEIYLELITQTHTAVDWSCAMEYSYNYTTVLTTEQPGTHSTGTHQTVCLRPQCYRIHDSDLSD